MTDFSKTGRRHFCASLASLLVLANCSARPDGPFRNQNVSQAANIAVLLPLTGDRSPLGRKMAKSIWLAEDMGVSPNRARILDSGNAPDTAAAAAAQAIAQGANVIVGPLFADQTRAVLKAANNVPVMTLSNDNALAQEGAWVLGVTPAQSVDAMLRYSREANASRITYLEMQGALGRRANAALLDGTRNSKLNLLPPIPGETSASQMAGAMRQVGGGKMPDIVYIPSAAPAALEKAVAAVGSGVTTIGSLQWSGLPPDQFKKLDKACFTGPDPAKFDALSAGFLTQLDEEMGVIGALAVDAVAVAQSAGGTSNIASHKPVDGLLGTTQFRSDHTCQRDLSILRIIGGGVSQVA